MSDGSIKLRYTGDNAGAVKAIQELQKQLASLEKENSKLHKESKKGSDEQIKASREVKKLLAEQVTAQEKHNRRVDELNKLLKAGQITQDQYGRAVRSSTEEMERAENAGKRAFGPQMQALIAGMAGGAGLGMVIKAWSVLRDEINATVDAKKRAGEESETLANAQAGALRNLGAVTADERDSFTQAIQRMSRELGVEQKVLYQAASDALSARGNLSIEAALNAVALGAQVAPDDTNVAKAVTGAALDIAKISGAAPGEAAGFLMQVGNMARVTDTGRLARSFTPALTAATANQASMETSGALFAALTGGMGDITGDQAKTAMIGLTRALSEFMPDVATAAERIALLQQDEKRRAEFLSSYSFEKAAATPIEQLLSGQGATAEAYNDFAGRMPGLQEAGVFFEDWLRVFKGGAMQGTGEIARAVDALKEGVSTASQREAREGILAEDLRAILQGAGMPSLAARASEFGTTITGSHLEDMLKAIESQAIRLGQDEKMVSAGFGGVSESTLRRASDVDRERSQLLLDFVERVREIQSRDAKEQVDTIATGNAAIVDKLEEISQKLDGAAAPAPMPPSAAGAL